MRKKLIKQRKKELYETQLTENIGKPKDLWKTLKTMGLPSKKRFIDQDLP